MDGVGGLLEKLSGRTEETNQEVHGLRPRCYVPRASRDDDALRCGSLPRLMAVLASLDSLQQVVRRRDASSQPNLRWRALCTRRKQPGGAVQHEEVWGVDCLVGVGHVLEDLRGRRKTDQTENLQGGS